MDPRKTFGKKIRKLREDQHLSQEGLAEITGLHRTYISGIERGIRNPTLVIITKFAKALHTSPGELMTNQE